MFTDAYDRIMNRIYRDGTVAVLCVNKKIKTCKVSDLPEKIGNGFIGVYNKDCKPEWLFDDLKWAEINFSN